MIHGVLLATEEIDGPELPAELETKKPFWIA
jgi:hypothetical protein